MPDRRFVRFLAPLALVAVAVVLVIVISSAGGGDSNSSTTTRNRTTATTARPRAKPRRYIVKSSDASLDSIGRKTGVPVDRLLALNPDLDPQTLYPGQRIRLR